LKHFKRCFAKSFGVLQAQTCLFCTHSLLIASERNAHMG